jgi:Fe2+ transport system protein FeoA
MRKDESMRIVKKVAGVALAMTTAAGAAVAASPTHEVTGRIEHLSPKRQHLTVRNQVYRYDPRLMGVGLRRGEQVRILYREQHGHRVAVRIIPAV